MRGPSIMLETMHVEAFMHTTFKSLIKEHYASLKKTSHNSESGRLWDERNYLLDLFSTMGSTTQKELTISDSTLSVDGMLKLGRLLIKIIEEEKIPEAAELTDLAETRGEKLIAQWLTEQWPYLLKHLKSATKRIKKIRWELMKAPPTWEE
mgnify:CR=1 FL=1